jgi:hypothetical protein
MSEQNEQPLDVVDDEGVDGSLERIQRDRKPGEIETGMMSGSDEYTISATERFEGELSEEEALQALAPDQGEAGGGVTGG